MLGRETFPKHERILRPKDYIDVFRNGTKTVGPAFICYVDRRLGNGCQLGLAVSRQVGKAVTRNRIKRYIREVYRKNRRHIDDPCRLVVVARPSAASMNYHACEDAIGQLFRRGGILHE